MTPSDGGQGAVPASPVTILAERLTSQQSLEQKEQHTWKMFGHINSRLDRSATAVLLLLSLFCRARIRAAACCVHLVAV